MIRKPLWLALTIATLLPAMLLTPRPLSAQETVLRPVISGFAEILPPRAGTFIGKIEATTTVGVAFEVLGRLTSRLVDEGDVVKAGQVLATIDAQSLEDQRNAARAALEGAEAQLVTAENALSRAKTLVARGSESPATLESAERNAAVARAQADQARAQLARAEDGVSRTEMTAPMDGIVIMTRHDAGTTVAAGDPVLVLASPLGRKARLTLPAPLIERLEIGAPFTVHSPELPPQGIKGHLLRVDPISVSETRMREAEIALEDQTDRLAIGQLVEVRLATGGEDVTAIPEAALLHEGDKTYVWRVKTEAQRRFVTRQEVTLGEATGEGKIAVEGLEAGAEVILRGTRSLSEGQEIGPATQIPSHGVEPEIIAGVK